MKTWAPFSLVVLGAVILWLLDFNFNDSGFVALMTVLIAVVGGSLTNCGRLPRRLLINAGTELLPLPTAALSTQNYTHRFTKLSGRYPATPETLQVLRRLL